MPTQLIEIERKPNVLERGTQFETIIAPAVTGSEETQHKGTGPHSALAPFPTASCDSFVFIRPVPPHAHRWRIKTRKRRFTGGLNIDLRNPATTYLFFTSIISGRLLFRILLLLPSLGGNQTSTAGRHTWAMAVALQEFSGKFVRALDDVAASCYTNEFSPMTCISNRRPLVDVRDCWSCLFELLVARRSP